MGTSTAFDSVDPAKNLEGIAEAGRCSLHRPVMKRLQFASVDQEVVAGCHRRIVNDKIDVNRRLLPGRKHGPDPSGGLR